MAKINMGERKYKKGLGIMAKAGRKTKLTPELQEQIVKYIEAGNYTKVACQVVGIGETTYYKWIRWGEKAEKELEEGKKLSDKENEFRQFRESIRGAEARAEIENVAQIQLAAKKDWRAALEMLARKYHKRWGLKKQIGGIGDEPLLPTPTVTVIVDTDTQTLKIKEIDKEAKAILNQRRLKKD